MRKIYFIISILILIIFFDSSVSANPIMSDIYGSSGNSALYLFVALTSLLVEYLIIRILLSPQVKFWRTLISFIVINLITFPITQVFGSYFLWFAELLPLICEPAMYSLSFQKTGINVPNLKLKIVAANLASFLLGILFYNIIPILIKR